MKGGAKGTMECAVFLLGLSLLLLTPRPGWALDLRMLTVPGPLAAAHRPFVTQCEKCHVPFRGIPNDRCLSCHEKVSAQLATRGFHAQYRDRSCVPCHTDHKGDKPMSPPLTAAFAHDLTGFGLRGRHEKLPCTGCHKQASSGRYVGADTRCVGCHQDRQHRGALGAECALCHDTSGWKHQIKDRASHRVPLLGGHEKIDCAGCHAQGMNLSSKVTCQVCHLRAHGGTRASCQTCHNTLSWKQATFTHDTCGCFLPGRHQTAPCQSCHPAFRFKPTPHECASCHAKDLTHEPLGACSICHSALSFKTRAFDHNRRAFGFPLTGRHLDVGCENCHTLPGIFKNAPRDCQGCHKVPRHGDFGPCAACHTTVGFDKPRFSHEMTRFPLAGAHEAVRCEICHARFAPGRFVMGGNDCVLCHGDQHKGQFREPARKQDSPQLPPLRTERPRLLLLAALDALGTPAEHQTGRRWVCRDCHESKHWKPSTVDAAMHAGFSFPLRGRHAGVACASCHPDGRFLSVPTRCASCHVDRHGGRLGSECARCHNERGFRETPPFAHLQQTGFALSDGHKELACARCHGERHERFLPKGAGCQGCHLPRRHGLNFGARCEDCHKPTRFADVPAFAHDEKALFPLSRRHAALPCLSCHDARKGARLSPACESCHGDPHRGGNGLECQECHQPDRWRLIRFDHDRTEFPLQGRHFLTLCGACHRNPQWTGLRGECIACHALDRPRTQDHLMAVDCGAMGCHTSFSWRMLRR